MSKVFLASNYSLLTLDGTISSATDSLSSRNVALATLNFSSTARASIEAVVVGPDADATCSILGGFQRTAVLESISNNIRSALYDLPLLGQLPLHRPDPSIIADLVFANWKGEYVAAAPSQNLSSCCVVPIVANSVNEARELLSHRSLLVLAIRLDDDEKALNGFAQLCAQFPYLVCYSGEPRASNDEVLSRIRSTFPLASSVVHVSELVAAIPPPDMIPTTWLLLHRELLRSSSIILPWEEATALACRCDVTDPDAVLAALECSISFVVPDQCVVPRTSSFLAVFDRVFSSAPDLRALPVSSRRAAYARLRRSLMAGTDVVHIARAAVKVSCSDEILLNLLSRFFFVHPVDDFGREFVVRTPSHTAANIAVHARLLRHADIFVLVDARSDGRLHFQRHGRRFIAWTEGVGVLHIHSDEASAEDLAAVREILS